MFKSAERIRGIRHDAGGHPTNKGGKKAVNFFNLGNFEDQGIELITGYPSETAGEIRILKGTGISINLPHSINTQKSIFTGVLNNVIETLKEEQVGHRKKCAGKTLTSAFQTTGYFFSKISEITNPSDSSYDSLVLGCVDDISKAIGEFKDRVKERGEPDDKISHMYENLEYALRQIRDCFDVEKETHINRKDAYMLAHFAEHEVQELKEIAQEIDERYGQ